MRSGGAGRCRTRTRSSRPAPAPCCRRAWPAPRRRWRQGNRVEAGEFLRLVVEARYDRLVAVVLLDLEESVDIDRPHRLDVAHAIKRLEAGGRPLAELDIRIGGVEHAVVLRPDAIGREVGEDLRAAIAAAADVVNCTMLPVGLATLAIMPISVTAAAAARAGPDSCTLSAGPILASPPLSVST